MESVMNAIRAIRNRRSEMNVPPSRKSLLYIETEKRDVFAAGIPFFQRLAYADGVELLDRAPEDHEQMVSCVTADARLYLPMNQLIDKEKELARVSAELQKAQQNAARYEAKLSNENFTSRAPEAVVNAEREKFEKAKALCAQLAEAEARLKAL